MALDLNFHSYFSIINSSDSTGFATKYNPFDEDNHSSHTYNSVSSPDITYDSSTGRVTFGAAGTYLIILCTTFTLNTSNNTTVVDIGVNGDARFESAPFYVHSSYDPVDQTFHLITTVNAGDYLEVGVDSQNASLVAAQNGTSLTVLKSNGDYGYLMYTSDASASGAGAEIALFDSNERTADTQTLKNVTYTAADGTLTPSNTRKFLMLSTLMVTHSAPSGPVNHGFYVDDSIIEVLPVEVSKNVDPLEMSIGLLNSLTADETCSARAQSGAGSRTVQANKGTAFSIFDITNNGTDPSAFLSLTVDGDSDAMTTGDQICFDSGEWGSYADTDFVTATGITFTADGGTFVVPSAGKYFILWNLVIGTATGSGERSVEIKNDGVVVYQTPWYMHVNTDPIEKTVCVILDAAAGSSFTFVVNSPNGMFDAGTAITMFKVDEVNDLYVQSVPTDSLIADDFTINGFSENGLSPQHDRVVQKQVPFLLGVPGPLSLRGRSFATTETPPNVSTGDKKN
jgi:hypothetical protein